MTSLRGLDRYPPCNGVVSLHVVVHGAQISASYVTVDGVAIAAGEVTNLTVGYRDTLTGKWLGIRIIALVSGTNAVSVTYVLKSEGGGELSRSATSTPAGGDVVVFNFAVLFE